MTWAGLFLLAPVSASQAQVNAGPELFAVSAALDRPAVSYFGEAAEGGRITLTAMNGFFDSGAFAAHGASPAPEEEALFIPKRYESLQVRSGGKGRGAAGGSARWHLWTEVAGELEVTAYLTVPAAEVGAVWNVTCYGHSYPVRSRASDGKATQGWKLRIPVGTGRHTVALAPADAGAAAATKIHRIELGGAVAESAKLLRARWRPAAVHTGYSSSTCDSSSVWVFESKSLNGASCYAPINTPFGYFGTTFDASRKAPRGINFSMWAAGKGKEAPPVTSMPHLLATGNPDAEFSGFGHEGSGVKLRGWDCLDWNPTSVIQALRIERRGPYDFYYGYFYHQPQQRWILHAAGARPPRRPNAPPEFSRVTAFTEVPGPPDRQRTGDVERQVARRGWFLDSEGEWHVADVHSCKDKEAASSRRIGSRSGEEGWHLSLMGGMEIVDGPQELALKAPAPVTLPEYLQPEKSKQLFKLPVRFTEHSIEEVKRTSVRVRYAISDLGPEAAARATLYYGTKDCLTFVRRGLHATERKGASAEFYTADRTWDHQTTSEPTEDGLHSFQLHDLEPNTQYFHRALVTHGNGKSWSFETGTFTTRS